MEVKNYTNIWSEEKKLYSIYEWTLPVPIGFRQLGLFALGAAVWCPIMVLFHVDIATAFGFALWFGPPIALAVLGNKPIFEGKSIFQYLRSIMSYLSQPKVIMDGRGVDMKKEKVVFGADAEENPQKHVIEVNYWVRDEDDEEDIRN